MMTKNYFRAGLRNIWKYKGYSFINTLGLTVGLSIFIVILLYIQYESNFDTFNDNYHRIYRVEESWKTARAYGNLPRTPYPLAPALKREFPGIVDTVRIISIDKKTLSVLNEDKRIFQNKGKFTDPSIFDIFTFPFVKGDPKTALAEPFSMVLTEETAGKLFDREDPLGKTINIKGYFDCKVTGVVKDLPKDSHLKFTFLVSSSSLMKEDAISDEESWKVDNVYTYIMLQDARYKELNEKITGFLKKHREEENATLYLKPLSRIHLHSNTNYELEPAIPVEMLYMLFIVGILILVIGCINFMNLSTAYSTTRAKEVGIRKVLGGTRFSLISQFLWESVLLAFISLLFALFLVYLYLPQFNTLLDTNVEFNILSNWFVWVELILIALLTGIGGGAYPAFVISAFQPARVLKNLFKKGRKSSIVMRILVVVQFTFCIIFIISSIVFHLESRFMRNMDKGFEEQDILTQHFSDIENMEKFTVLKNELIKMEGIKTASISSHLPFAIYSEIEINWEEQEEMKSLWTTHARIDSSTFDTYGLELKEGRNFSEEYPSDRDNACIINETFMERLGWNSSSPGKILTVGSKKYNIIGVVKDFLSSDMRLATRPLLLRPFMETGRNFNTFYFSIRFVPGNKETALHSIKTAFAELLPGELPEMMFFTDILYAGFVSFDNLNKILIYFSIISVIVAVLGLYALTAFITRQRTKEITIRKVYGASVQRILTLLFKDFSKVMIAAFVIGWPLAYLAMNGFLQNFAHRIQLDAWIFLVSGAIVFLAAALTVSYHTIKAAFTNPADSLRYE